MLIIQLNEDVNASTDQTILHGFKVEFICPYYKKNVSNSMKDNTEYDKTCPYYEKEIGSVPTKPNAGHRFTHPYYMMVIYDISSPKNIIIKRDYEDEKTAQNAPNEIIYIDNGGEHYFEKSSTSNDSVIWTLKK